MKWNKLTRDQKEFSVQRQELMETDKFEQKISSIFPHIKDDLVIQKKT